MDKIGGTKVVARERDMRASVMWNVLELYVCGGTEWIVVVAR